MSNPDNNPEQVNAVFSAACFGSEWRLAVFAYGLARVEHFAVSRAAFRHVAVSRLGQISLRENAGHVINVGQGFWHPQEKAVKDGFRDFTNWNQNIQIFKMENHFKPVVTFIKIIVPKKNAFNVKLHL